MAIYRAPGVFFTEYTQSIGSTAFGYNRTAIIGVGQTYTNVSNLELVRGASDDSDSDVSNVDTILLPSGVPAVQGDILSIQGIGNIPGYYNYTLGTDYTIKFVGDVDKIKDAFLTSKVEKLNDKHVRFYFKKDSNNKELPLILSQLKIFSANKYLLKNLLYMGKLLCTTIGEHTL